MSHEDDSFRITTCPKCDEGVTFMYGLGGAGSDGPGAYWVCLSCHWQGPKPQEVVCFPHGLAAIPNGA